jgi:ribosomal protein S7
MSSSLLKIRSIEGFSEKRITIKKLIINYSMLQGKQVKCHQVFKKSTKLMQKYLKKDSKEIFKLSVTNSLPVINSKKLVKKRGKQAILQEIPFILSKPQRIKFSIKCILSNLKKGLSLKGFTRLCSEILFNSRNFTQKKKDISDKEMLTVKKYAKFRWFL